MGYTPSELQRRVELFGVDETTAEIIRHRLPPSTTLGARDLNNGRLDDAIDSGTIDAALLGLKLEDPVRLAQRIHAVDKQVPIVILSKPGHDDLLRRTLMYSPFLGSEVIAWPADDVDELPNALQEAADRRRQRKRYHDTIASAEIRLEMLPLLQPEATHYLDQLLDHVPIGVITVDTAGTIVTLNSRACATLGVSERRALGASFIEFFPDSEKTRLSAIIEDCYDWPERFPPEVRIKAHDQNGDRVIEITAAALSYRTGQRGIMLMLKDVTAQVAVERERQRAEDELRLHATVLRAFHEISSTHGQDLKQKIQRILQLGCEQFGMPIGMLTKVDGDSMTVLDSNTHESIFATGARLAVHDAFCRAAIASAEPVAVERAGAAAWRLPAGRPGGKEVAIEAYLGTRVQVNGSVYGTLCFLSRKPREASFGAAAREILKLMSQWLGSELQREHAEADMRKLSGAVEQTADSVIITNREWIIEYVNASFEKLTGYNEADIVGRKAEFHRSGTRDNNNNVRRVLAAGGVFQGPLTGRKKDGLIFHEQKTISPLKDRDGKTTHFIATGRDITELVKAQENDRLRQAELAHVARLSTLGEMTSGLAHELNQPLCAITTYAQTCLRVIQSGERDIGELRYGLDQIVAQAELGSNIFRRLRDFARKGHMERQLINVSDIINEVVGLIGWETQHKLIRVKIMLARDLPQIRVDPIQIEQVLLNLVRNSFDAMAGLEERRRHIVIRGTRDKGNLLISISDGGRGCAPAQADRLFEPFFTTKPTGLGIGLTVSQSLIEAHGGRLWLKSNSRRGATFCFTLPVCESAA